MPTNREVIRQNPDWFAALLDEEQTPAMTPGEYVCTFIRATLGEDKEALDTLTRAVQNELVASTLGIIPTLIVGDLIKFVDAIRYAVNAMRECTMPGGGKTFTRPLVVTRTLAGAQANELDVLQSQAMVINPQTITKHTHGTVLNVSEQDLDWTDPALMQLAIEDMAESYAISTEAEAALAIETAVVHSTNDGTLGVTVPPTPAQFQTAIANGAASLYAASKALPDVLFAAPDRWAYMAGLVDSTGRPIYPSLGPTNAPGQLQATSWDGAPLGLKLVVSPAFRAGFTALGVSRFCEKYEQVKGQIQIPSPSTLAVTVAYRGYFTTNVQTKGIQALSELGADLTWDSDLT